MNEPTIRQAKITGGFWQQKLQLNNTTAIFYQWDQLESTRCIDNFRIAAGLKQGFREGFFFSDSDAYKWLDAASRILAHSQDQKLTRLVDDFISILEAAQQPDGYLYTYNQIHFPAERWTNLQIQHEFYCLGHLIEAGISHFESTSGTKLLKVAQKAADLLVREFTHAAPDFTDGHEEIEIALIKLYRSTCHREYLDLAQAFLERRGTISNYPFKFIKQTLDTSKRMSFVKKEREAYLQSHPQHSTFSLPARNKHKVPLLVPLRFTLSALSGSYTQQQNPFARQSQAVGHSVRFAYLQIAAAMLARDTSNPEWFKPLTAAWQNMTQKRMFVTGGIGSLPLSEGFGKDYELDPETAYAETCAALGSMLWNHEMALLTAEPCYEDLFEWQLYNAASVGIAQDGCSYFYNNPLACRGGITRAGWYDIPCCPSNLSRIWASLGRNIVSTSNNQIYINQYITSQTSLDLGQNVLVNCTSNLPWQGSVEIRLTLEKPALLDLFLRLPAWSDSFTVSLNDILIEGELSPLTPPQFTANGLDFGQSRWLKISREFKSGDQVKLELSMPVRRLRQDQRIPHCGGQVALARGPIVYCLESVDHSFDIFKAVLNPDDLTPQFDPALLGGTWVLKGMTTKNEPMLFIPYMLWGNRGESQMTVFVRD